jgi:hypothetical protein
MFQVVNLTPHLVRLCSPSGEVLHELPAPAKGSEARVGEVPGTLIGSIAGVEIYSPPTRGAVENLPDPREGVTYLVSAIVADEAAKAGRRDVARPGTGPQDGAVRKDGQVWGVTRVILALA